MVGREISFNLNKMFGILAKKELYVMKRILLSLIFAGLCIFSFCNGTKITSFSEATDFMEFVSDVNNIDDYVYGVSGSYTISELNGITDDLTVALKAIEAEDYSLRINDVYLYTNEAYQIFVFYGEDKPYFYVYVL